MDVQAIRQRMNEWGRQQRPFLFGVNFELTEGFFIADPFRQQDIFFSVRGKGNKENLSINTEDEKGQGESISLACCPVGFDQYKQKFDVVHNALKRGDSFLTNLTVKTPVEVNHSLEDIFRQDNSLYQLLVPDRFVCFSPERFVCVDEGVISTNPMKGTIDAAVQNAEQVILSDFKETAEHNTIVDLLRNDLSLVATEVEVKRFRYIDRICTKGRELLQVSSEIVGKLEEDYLSHLGDIIYRMLPAGSVSGAPKQSTLDLIRRVEGEERGFYTGIFGLFDGSKLDTGVLIRFIEKEGEHHYFRSGGGITAYSNAKYEYQEVLEKIYLPE